MKKWFSREHVTIVKDGNITLIVHILIKNALIKKKPFLYVKYIYVYIMSQ